jgi:hypothetical protein
MKKIFLTLFLILIFCANLNASESENEREEFNYTLDPIFYAESLQGILYNAFNNAKNYEKELKENGITLEDKDLEVKTKESGVTSIILGDIYNSFTLESRQDKESATLEYSTKLKFYDWTRTHATTNKKSLPAISYEIMRLYAEELKKNGQDINNRSTPIRVIEESECNRVIVFGYSAGVALKFVKKTENNVTKYQTIFLWYVQHINENEQPENEIELSCD